MNKVYVLLDVLFILEYDLPLFGTSTIPHQAINLVNEDFLLLWGLMSVTHADIILRFRDVYLQRFPYKELNMKITYVGLYPLVVH